MRTGMMRISVRSWEDVMLQVLMHSHIAQEENRFTIEDVVDMLAPQAGAAAPSCVRRQESIDT